VTIYTLGTRESASGIRYHRPMKDAGGSKRFDSVEKELCAGVGGSGPYKNPHVARGGKKKPEKP